MGESEITFEPPIKPELGGIAERTLNILPPVIAVALLVWLASYAWKKATSPGDRRS